MPEIRSLFTHDDEEMVAFVDTLPRDAYFLESDGRVCENLDAIPNGKLIAIHFRMCGGKGGFGSLLRSFRIHKSSNQLMCRNLQGRRMADVREEQRLKKWVEKKAQREKEKTDKEKEKIDKLKNGANSKHEFKDQEYLRRRDTVLDEVEDAIEAGIKAIEAKKAEESSETTEQHAVEEKCAASSSYPENTDVYDANEEDKPSTSSSTGKHPEPEESSSDSDLDLNELMSAGPLKKKAKRG